MNTELYTITFSKTFSKQCFLTSRSMEGYRIVGRIYGGLHNAEGGLIRDEDVKALRGCVTIATEEEISTATMNAL